MAVKVAAPPAKEVTETQESAELVLKKSDLPRLELTVEVVANITSDKDLANANEVLRTVATERQAIVDLFEPAKSAAFATHKQLCALEKKFLQRFDKLREAVESGMKKYLKAREQREQENQRRIEAFADEMRRNQLADARRLAKEGDLAGARQIREQAEAIVAPVVSSEPVKLDGTKIRTEWEIEITNLPALLQAALDGVAPIQAVTADLAYLKKRARELDGLNWPGVKATPEKAFSVSKG